MQVCWIAHCIWVHFFSLSYYHIFKGSNMSQIYECERTDGLHVWKLIVLMVNLFMLWISELIACSFSQQSFTFRCQKLAIIIVSFLFQSHIICTLVDGTNVGNALRFLVFQLSIMECAKTPYVHYLLKGKHIFCLVYCLVDSIQGHQPLPLTYPDCHLFHFLTSTQIYTCPTV